MSGTTAAGTRPVAIPVSTTLPWLIGVLLFGLLVYYVVGINAGLGTLLGNTTTMHEFLHDARHFLGFPCH